MNFLQKIQRILAGVLRIDHRNTSEREKVCRGNRPDNPPLAFTRAYFKMKVFQTTFPFQKPTMAVTIRIIPKIIEK